MAEGPANGAGPGPADDRRQQLEDWRREQQKQRQSQMAKWLTIGQSALCVAIPQLGFWWVLFHFATAALVENKATELRLRGVQLAGWMLLGVVLWLIVWKLWGYDMLRALTPKFDLPGF